uniref:Spike glycoprotein n=1 Tax=Bat Coronavirus HpHI19 TaxID=3018840 RepID=A0AA49EAU9_9NIDO|nr:spike glycoprotein [Bat Coronavirus HpHI19]
MISLAIYLAELIVIISKFPTLADQCQGTPWLAPNLNLGLAPNLTNVYVPGLLPTTNINNWYCRTNQYYFTGYYGVYVSYHSFGMPWSIGVSNSDTSVVRNTWSLYVSHGNNRGTMTFRICKWAQLPGLAQEPTPNTGGAECVVNKQFPFTFQHEANEIVGVTWSSDYVRIYGLKNTYRFYFPNKWNKVNVNCGHKHSCQVYPVKDSVTWIVNTTSTGLVKSYTVCDNCRGFPQHVFPVQLGGKIPADFTFDGWYVLTNSSTLLQGKFVDTQPLKLLCLWPVPALDSSAAPVSFNLSQNQGAVCNGEKTVGLADALRFSMNFTKNGFSGAHSVTLKSAVDYVFSCTNDTNVTLTPFSFVPFGHVNTVYRCFVVYNNTNGTVTEFVGVLPPLVKEFVVSRYGTVYVNGVRIFTIPQVHSVVFNVTSNVGSDFWTVAFAQNADVLLEVSSTDIVNLHYCDSVLNKVKCQQLAFTLPDGFYPTTHIVEQVVPKTYVTLPYHATHTFIELNITVSLYERDQISLTGGGMLTCVNTTQFTTKFWTNAAIDGGTYEGVVLNVNCPFDFLNLNNYLSFDSICFSLTPIAGGCTMRLAKQVLTTYFDISTLYVSFTPGSKITGVMQPTGGVYDPSILHLGVCTDYVIYGHTGRGVINLGNSTYVAGLYYTSFSGQLLGFKNSTTGSLYVVQPCDLSSQVAVYNDVIIGAMTASSNVSFGFSNISELPSFYYHTDGVGNCSKPILEYGSMGLCPDGGIVAVSLAVADPVPVSPIATTNVSVPRNFTISIQTEYIQMYSQQVSIDCSMYVCNGNVRCLRLLSQYATACRNIESALQLSARLESLELSSAISVSERAYELANISNFDHYNMSVLLPKANGKSVIEDILFDKVVTSGLGTVDQDYKNCVGTLGVAHDIADVGCAQYYNGIMVLPGVVNDVKMGLYTASLTGAMVMGGFTAAAAIPFSLAVQSRLNYVALQTDVLQQNQQILANSFNSAMSNITAAFSNVNQALQDTSQAINTVATALSKVQSVVNEQGQAVSHLTQQLSHNFQAISHSIADIYNRLDDLAADAQTDRLITGRLAALNAFVTQTLTKYAEVKQSRLLAQEKVNECVKSQSSRYGFCGNGTHLFSVVNSAPNGLVFFHTVLVPTVYVTVSAWAGVCFNNKAFILKNVNDVLFNSDGYFVTSRSMYEPRVPQMADFVQVDGCVVSYLNLSDTNINSVIPDYIDVNKTLDEFLQQLPNHTVPDFGLDIYNNTILNLTAEIDVLQNKSDQLLASTERLQQLIDNLNKTYVDLEWLNRFEQYVKWPWYVWLAIFLATILFSFLMLYCCCATGCCGCFSCLSNSCDCRGKNLQRYEVEKVHIQ